MDMLPSQVVRFGQLGMEEVLESQTIWTCAACLTCVARCPKGIDLPRVMEAMRILAAQKQGSHMDSEHMPAELVGELPQLAIIGSFRKNTP
jgi:heterodisulfide reductase subunit C